MAVTRDTSHRRQKISELVRQNGSVQVSALAQRFGVSMQTVRKDLRYLAERG
ncbi:MAG TPA: DeoR family transcriptional regulator, partial [Pseudoxanthomonas sp.]|nr:DeoR family transcriptional regulator [Pseudoxanthomonas sp.]